jgi:hypothetical protein
MDYADPRWVWYGAGLTGLVSAAAFYLLERQVGRFTWATVDRRLSIMQQLEEGEITAEEAASSLESLKGGKLAALAPSGSGRPVRHEPQSTRSLRVQVSDLASGIIKTDLRLPLGLVNTTLSAGGRLSVQLDRLDGPALRELINKSIADATAQTMETLDERVEVCVE